jgi:hypothetical protein
MELHIFAYCTYFAYDTYIVQVHLIWSEDGLQVVRGRVPGRGHIRAPGDSSSPQLSSRKFQSHRNASTAAADRRTRTPEPPIIMMMPVTRIMIGCQCEEGPGRVLPGPVGLQV